jgi:hypothetical protein
MSDRLVHWIEHFCRGPTGLRKGDRVLLAEEQFEQIEEIYYNVPEYTRVATRGELGAYLMLAHIAGPMQGKPIGTVRGVTGDDCEMIWDAASPELQKYLSREGGRITFTGKPLSDDGPRAA